MPGRGSRITAMLGAWSVPPNGPLPRPGLVHRAPRLATHRVVADQLAVHKLAIAGNDLASLDEPERGEDDLDVTGPDRLRARAPVVNPGAADLGITTEPPHVAIEAWNVRVEHGRRRRSRR